MPIRRSTRFFYPIDWPQISDAIRFGRAKGRCEQCQRPHGHLVKNLPDGRWFDATANHWRDDHGHEVPHPMIEDFCRVRIWKVILAACHRDHDPRNCHPKNLASWCQRCHLLHDRHWHAFQRRLTVLERRALGDLFDGPYMLRRWQGPPSGSAVAGR